MLSAMVSWWREPPQWQERTQTTSLRGLSAALVLFFVPRSISELFILLLGATRRVDTFPQGLALTGVALLTMVATLALLQVISGKRLRFLLAGGLPSIGPILKWAGWGALVGGYQFARNLTWGFRLGEPLFGAMILTAVLTECVVYPLIEEPIYRGIALPALARATRSRSLAYLGSAALFTVSHAPSHMALLRHGKLGLSSGAILMLMSLGLLTAHAYWTTGKLSLSMVVHGVMNGMKYLALPIGYLIFLPPAQA